MSPLERFLASVMRIDAMRARLMHDRKGEVEDLIEVGRLIFDPSNPEETEAALTKAVALGREIDHQDGVARAVGQLGALHFAMGKYDRAREELESSVAGMDSDRHRRIYVLTLLKLGTTASKLGDWTSAVEYWRRALDMSRNGNDQRLLAESLIRLGQGTYELELYSEAERYFSDALRKLDVQRSPELVVYATFFRGVIARHFGRLDEALDLMIRSRDMYRDLRDYDHLRQADEYIARLQSPNLSS